MKRTTISQSLMQKMLHYTAALLMGLWLSAVLTACEESGDLEQPVITIVSPSAGDTVLYSAVLVIKVEISDNEALSQYVVNLRNEDAGTLDASWFDQIEGKTFTLDTTHLFPNMGAHNWRLRVEVLDESGNEGFQFIDFYGKP